MDPLGRYGEGAWQRDRPQKSVLKARQAASYGFEAHSFVWRHYTSRLNFDAGEGVLYLRFYIRIVLGRAHHDTLIKKDPRRDLSLENCHKEPLQYPRLGLPRT